MQRWIEIFRSGQQAVLIYPAGSAATFAALLVVLVPFLTGTGIVEGLKLDETAALEAAGDLYVSGSRFGQRCPLPEALDSEIRNIDGVLSVVPRVAGSFKVGRDQIEATVIGLPESAFPKSIRCVTGRLPEAAAPHELVVGTSLANRLNLTTGAQLPPFYRNPEGERTSVVVGLFDARNPFWQSRMILTTLTSAQRMFAQPDRVTDFAVWCKPGYSESVRATVLRTIRVPSEDNTVTHLSVSSREALVGQAIEGEFRKLGVFTLHFVVEFTAALLVILVTSGYGQTERRREIGILKATGWQTDEVLLKAFAECLVISVTAASVSLVIALIWLRCLNGAGIAGVFIPDLDAFPGFAVPFRLQTVSVMLAFVISLSLTLSGSLYSSWRSAIVPPDEAMR